ncbi:potassium channel family protein [Thiolapillus sp.]|uniref:potassium channel family protein n=2 Tax=Thiolapillus sp. TaxID=2017437 RepID=UPI003AF714AD
MRLWPCISFSGWPGPPSINYWNSAKAVHFPCRTAQHPHRPTFFQMWYFSMVTLTTLGYGDIVPVSMAARVFVVLEAILGQLYLAILISGLIGKGIAQNKH